MTDLEKLEENIKAIDASMAGVQMAMDVSKKSTNRIPNENLQKALNDLVTTKKTLITLRDQLISKESL